ncbi:MAG: hypothetical protein ACI9H1_000294 [Polaribacter sp.]|jgi:hypothetical protein|tara:strand:- start:234 stop:668 length:435 start_codon:yes stop_codon:yes gene_type:complete
MNSKLFIAIFFLSICLSSCLNFGEEKTYEPNSKETNETIEWLLGLKLGNQITNSNLYENSTGLDPYYYAKFSVNNFDFENELDSTWSKSKTSGQVYVSENDAPEWYKPITDSASVVYTNKFNGGSKSIIHNIKTTECFVLYSTY